MPLSTTGGQAVWSVPLPIGLFIARHQGRGRGVRQPQVQDPFRLENS